MGDRNRCHNITDLRQTKRLMDRAPVEMGFINGKPLGELPVIIGHITPNPPGEIKATGRRSGETLDGKGVIAAADTELLLALQRNMRTEKTAGAGLRLGELLVAMDLFTNKQLNDALSHQKDSNKSLGEVLIEAGYLKEYQVNYGLTLQKRLLAASLAALFSYITIHEVSAVTPNAEAENSATNNTLTVTAMVKPFTALTVVKQPEEMVITHSDIRRGYVDINAATEFDIRNNSLAGYILIFEYSGTAFREVRVTGLGSEVVISPGTAWVAQPHRGTVHDYVELSYRFNLSKDALPGIYVWPISTSIEPL